MTDEIKTEIKSFAAKEEAVVKAWFGSNWVPVAIGAVITIVVESLLHLLKII